ncbi:MAG: tetratricopeptide repeat protein [Herminiimonas sp.]|nr:tetratricopeptide repeat protein [Herminiimonas sp.]
MSLINKMLQDLEARSPQGINTGFATGPVRAVPQRHRSYAIWSLAAALVLASAGAGAWLLRGHRIVPPAVMASAVTAPTRAPGLKMAVDTPPVAPATVVAAPVLVEVSKPAVVEAPLVIVSNNKNLENSNDEAREEAGDKAKGKANDKANDKPAERPSDAKKPLTEMLARTGLITPPKSTALLSLAPPRPVLAAQSRPAKAAGVLGNSTVDSPGNGLSESPSPVVRQVSEATPAQRADNEFRKATAQIDDGRTGDAIVTLEQVLQIDPLHGTARQTLVGLLVQTKRQDDAVRRLQEGLRLDSTQPGAAMILARLQVERGEQAQAVSTLQRTLPYATDRADYQSFLAALLQREGRHKEAVEKYLVALGKAPQNGVWWMGMAISLQADNRSGEALEAFLRAKATSTLSPDLVAFVDQKLVQLGR